jgi:hypothetical protein
MVPPIESDSKYVFCEDSRFVLKSRVLSHMACLERTFRVPGLFKAVPVPATFGLLCPGGVPI